MLGLEETMALSKGEKQALGTQGTGWLQTLCVLASLPTTVIMVAGAP